MATHRAKSNSKVAKAVGVGFIAGGLLLGAPAGMAFADASNQVGGFLNFAANGVNKNAQNVVNLNNKGTQNAAAQLQPNANAANSTAQATVNTTNGFVKFVVFGILK
jgi:hypothetical protein